MNEEDTIDNEDSEQLIERYMATTHLKAKATSSMPLQGKKITTKNLHLLQRTTVVLTEPFIEDVEELNEGEKIITVEIDKIGHEPEYMGKGKKKQMVKDTRKKFMLTGIQRKINKDDDFLTIATRKYPLSWYWVFRNSEQFFKITDRKLKKWEAEGVKIVPRKADIFRAFHLCPFPSVKVVIVGQDPYYQKNVACGLSFAVRKGFEVPHSLKLIYSEIAAEYRKEKKQYKIPNHGDLTPWAKQGVLLLNMALTTELNKAGKHKHRWDAFVSEVIRSITRYHENIVFMLWGADARKAIKKFIIGKHYVLEAAHPAARFKTKESFQGCGHFIECNRLLEEAEKEPIDWRL